MPTYAKNKFFILVFFSPASPEHYILFTLFFFFFLQQDCPHTPPRQSAQNGKDAQVYAPPHLSAAKTPCRRKLFSAPTHSLRPLEAALAQKINKQTKTTTLPAFLALNTQGQTAPCWLSAKLHTLQRNLHGCHTIIFVINPGIFASEANASSSRDLLTFGDPGCRLSTDLTVCSSYVCAS
ncbi:uncharacterized protein NEMAJ01_2133 [Nematocida major]|uniref:uncharacterized protein n=1 Tax=Nematocida major TaxID=1912982 RepID=UPI0020075AA5|nr:uncharacterized protein NEMAJ01_2133 [Nematocida major]KAH9387237.1 hypothetical protein NEMAJ01_2133 [Nematocida major]